jgi:hypothetical protein
MENISFHAHHSPFGAYASFIIGKLNSGAGFDLSNVQPQNNNFYVGYKRDEENAYLMPFLSSKRQINHEEAYVVKEHEENQANGQIHILTEKDIHRRMTWAQDLWTVNDLEFKIVTPFGHVNELEKMSERETRLCLLPAVFAQLTFDNSASEKTAEVVFGMEGMRRLISDTMGETYRGGACQTSTAFACVHSDEIEEKIGWGMLEQLWEETAVNKLGNEVVLNIKVKPGEKKTYTFVLATYQGGIITSGIPSQFMYTKYFQSIEDVISFALENKDYYLELAQQRDQELQNSDLNEYRQFQIAHATRSYYANTQLMVGSDEKPIWMVNEGEYQMINTFDLTVDQLFYEMRFHPWTTRNVLDLYLQRYGYIDGVKDMDSNHYQGGKSFTHDMGVANMFSPPHYSSYERVNIDGCFSYMTHEQLVNWIICAANYGIKHQDFEWLKEQEDVFKELLDSLINRDRDDDGIMDCDSTRCGTGTEITTYDALDESLGQARNNLYLAVKTWAAYISLEKVFALLGFNDKKKLSHNRANQAASTIVTKFDKEAGYIPAVFEKGNQSKIIPAVEGLIFPFLLGDYDAVSENGRFSHFIQALKKHIKTILVQGECIDAVSGAWKLSSTSYNTWMSKIYISQYIIQHILNMDYSEDEWTGWDIVHSKFQQKSCNDLCAVDQLDSRNGQAMGSRLYPRLVTNILWLSDQETDL